MLIVVFITQPAFINQSVLRRCCTIQSWWWEEDVSLRPFYCPPNASGHQANAHPSPSPHSNSIVLSTSPFNVSTPFHGWKMPHTRELSRTVTWQCGSSLWDKKILINPVGLFWQPSPSSPSPDGQGFVWNSISVISSRCCFVPLRTRRGDVKKIWRVPSGSVGQFQ